MHSAPQLSLGFDAGLNIVVYADQHMPAVSLVVCLYKERDLLERLLQKAEGCYDDLVVVHDGPEESSVQTKRATPRAFDFSTLGVGDSLPVGYREPLSEPKPNSIHALVVSYGGRFFEHPRVGSLEGQSAFAWSRAVHNWILRLDADEFPSHEMKTWLVEFRAAEEPLQTISGFTCIWPMWDGKQQVSFGLFRGRLFLFDRRKVRYFGMTEQTPIPEGEWSATDLVLLHQPKRQSYGLKYLFKHWMRWLPLICMCLDRKPTDLNRWRWHSPDWPSPWCQIKQKPLRSALKRLARGCIYQYREFKRSRERVIWEQVLACGLHGAMIPFAYYFHKKSRRRKQHD